MTNNEFRPYHPSHLITFRNQQNHFLQLSLLIHFRNRNHDPQNNSCDIISECRIVWQDRALKRLAALKMDWDCWDVLFQLNRAAIAQPNYFISMMTMLLLPTHTSMLVEYQFLNAAHSFFGLIKVICGFLHLNIVNLISYIHSMKSYWWTNHLPKCPLWPWWELEAHFLFLPPPPSVPSSSLLPSSSLP